ncbi:hypothetical protein BaRGS_00036103 [Batillaria attramentaria]|uniref:Uncharacterized protein n=1 Tax=Batillaria attramentaria TaxID=370345 RepID=A0ABD0JCU6_9CAEN
MHNSHSFHALCSEEDVRTQSIVSILWSLTLKFKKTLTGCHGPSERLDEQRQQLLGLLDPHTLFILMVTLTHFDSSLMIDWLTAPEPAASATSRGISVC